MGLFSLLYPEQSTVLQHWHQVKSIAYRDETIALQTVLQSMLLALSKNEKCLVIIPDEGIRNQFLHLLDSWQLKALSFFYDPGKTVTKQDIHGLQEVIQTRKEKSRSVDLELLQHEFEYISNEISSILTSFHEVDMGRNLLTVLERKEDVSGFSNKTMIDAQRYELLPEITEVEFDRLYDQIVYAASLYETEFYHRKSTGKFSVSSLYLQSEITIEDFIFKMSDFVQQMETLRAKYFSFMNETLAENNIVIRQQYSSAKNQLAHFIFLDHLLSKYKKLDSGTAWQKMFGKGSDSLETITENWKKSLEDLQKSLAMLQDFQTRDFDAALLEKETFKKHKKLEEVESALTTWYQNSREKQKFVFKHSNIFNQRETTHLQKLENDFHQLIQQVNQANLLENKLEINTLSLQKHTELLSTYIQECMFLVEDLKANKKYYLWEHFYKNTTTQVKSAVHILQHFPTKDWPMIMEYIFLQQWIEGRLKPNYTRLYEMVNAWMDILQTLPKLWVENKVYTRIQERAESTKNVSGIERSLLQKIMANKDLDRLNWRYFFEQNARLWSTLFDVVIAPEDKFEDIEPGLFSNLVYVNPKSINPEVLHLGKTIHTYYPEGVMSCDLEIPQGSLDADHPHQVLSALTTFNTSKTLANNFFSIQKRFCIYQSRTANIISCLSPHVNTTIFTSLEEGKFKELSPGQKNIDVLMESIIETSRQKYLVMHDHFLDPVNHATYAIQLKVIEDFRDNGFLILSLQTEDLIHDYVTSLQKFQALIA